MKRLSTVQAASAACLGLVGALIVVLFHWWGNTYAGIDVRSATPSIFVWLAERWQDSALSFGGNYSHGWLVPLVALWLIWRRRAEWKAAVGPVSWLGLAVVVGALGLHWIGARGELPQVSVVALIALCWGFPTFLYGRRVGARLLVPCAYLLFAVPFGFFENSMFPLRILATVGSDWILNGLGIAVWRDGTALHSAAGGGFSLDVADPCSGIRSLLALMALTAAYAYVTQPTRTRQWALFLSSIPLAVLGNMARVVSVGLVAVAFGMQVATGLYHDYSGYVFYAVAISAMLGLDRAMNRIRPAHRPPMPAPETRPVQAGPDPRADRIRLAASAAVVLLLIGTVIAVARTARVTASDGLAVRAALPETVGPWHGEEVRFCQNEACLREYTVTELAGAHVCPACGGPLSPLSLAEHELLPADTVIVRRLYQRPGGPSLSAAVVFSGRGRASIHRPEICLVGQGYRVRRSAVQSVALEGRGPLQVEGLTLEHRGGGRGAAEVQRAYFAYWFVGDRGRETPSHFARLVWMTLDRILHGEATRWAYISILTANDARNQTGPREAAQFIRALYPSLAGQ